MNFLAHLFITNDDEELLIGNFIADFIKNKEVKNYSAGIQQGIMLHRKIDAFTDRHKKVKKGTRRLQAAHRKYAPVIVDIFYDYLLANNWERYSTESLEDFCVRVYEILERRIDDLPKKLRKRLPTMIEHRWLQAYKTEAGMRYTFERLAERLSKPEYLEGVMENLLAEEEKFTKEFNSFFPDVMEYVEECRESLAPL